MKKHLLKLGVVSLLAIIVASGCTKKKDQQILDLQAEKARLEREYERKDSLLNELFISMNAIEKNLAEITLKEKMINDVPSGELRSNADVRDNIMDEIILINNIIEENKKRIANLKDQLKKADANIASLQETIKTLNTRIEEKEREIAALKEELVKLNFSIAQLNATVDTLQEANAEKSKVINQQELVIGEMNTIWYTVGTKKDLMDKGVIDKSGGLFSGDTKMTDMINADNFTTGDIRKLTEVSFETKKAELATVHPAGTYEFIMEGEILQRHPDPGPDRILEIFPVPGCCYQIIPVSVMNEFQQQILRGIPENLPEPKPFDTSVSHAPKRKDILTREEKKLALKNALRYFEPKHHPVLGQGICRRAGEIRPDLHVPFPAGLPDVCQAGEGIPAQILAGRRHHADDPEQPGPGGRTTSA